MYHSTQMNQDMRQIYSHMNYQANQIAKLESIIETLQKDISALKEKPPIHIDKIEYKFDQLKVERLEGTLTIGVTPNGLKSIEDMAVNGKSMEDMAAQSQPQSEPDQLQQISHHIRKFLDEEAPKEIHQLEVKYNLDLTKEFHEMMIADLNKQMGQRIQHYVNQAASIAQNETRQNIQQSIISTIKRDINVALNSYFENLTKKEDTP